MTLDQAHLIELAVRHSPRYFSRKPWRTPNGYLKVAVFRYLVYVAVVTLRFQPGIRASILKDKDSL
ncbi:MAG TPA: hypothetical protein DDX19_01520 [Rhodopirellula baltica]|uniref:Uncharacterized protein n=1 Tax=Rhodopirellula baltica (strain DSM 10527 / NCIMB 13988 / SH1) TaxID=243090 RepID=Q7UXX1_RHOBA|nr:hypothetical protein-transmembrane prediction [Rhodopirellula baltica SH 1]HBE61457.1 hypothetical protein [Rhodopirellula baltica]